MADLSDLFLKRPLDYLGRYLAPLPAFDTNKVLLQSIFEHAQKQLADVKTRIPRLETVSHTDLPNYTLVQFRAMVQDPSLRKEALSIPKGVDAVPYLFSEQQSLNEEALETLKNCSHWQATEYLEKQPYYCVQVPNERSQVILDVSKMADQDLALKRAKTPYVAPTAPAVVAKVYDELLTADKGDLKLNDIVNLIGILEYETLVEDPRPALATEPSVESTLFACDALPGFTAVPRLHVLSIERVEHLACPRALELASRSDVELDHSTHKMAVELFANSLGGDVVAAEFVWAFLFGRLSGSVADGSVIGRFGLNLYGASPSVRSSLRQLLKSLPLRVMDLPLTIDKLNCERYNSHALLDESQSLQVAGVVSGVLQVPNGTLLLVDETVLTTGQLNNQGVSNLQALQKLIQQSKLTCDFGYQQIDVLSDVCVLVLSEGKSMFTTDFKLAVKQPESEFNPNLDSSVATSVYTILSKFYMDNPTYEISDSVSEAIQKDFIKSRQEQKLGGLPVTKQGDLFKLLNLARCVTLSFGQSSLTKEYWDYAKAIEKDRLQREFQSIKVENGASNETDLPQR